jgi:hypothetical protein
MANDAIWARRTPTVPAWLLVAFAALTPVAGS